jgi:hypothetical protein
MSKKRAKCPRLYLLDDKDMLQVLCCGSNLESFSANVYKVFKSIRSLKIESVGSNIGSSASGEKKCVIGCTDKNNEYFPFKNVNININ